MAHKTMLQQSSMVCRHMFAPYQRVSAVSVRTAVSAAAAHAHPRAESELPNKDPGPSSKSDEFVRNVTPYMVKTYVRPSPIMVKGEGCYLWDAEGRQFLDFTAGIAVNSLGHCDVEMSQIMYDQSQKLVHASNLYHNEWTGALSQLLVSRTRDLGGMYNATQAFISNSGSEANEAAIKFCRKVGKIRQAQNGQSASKHEILSFHSAFHGRTMGSLSATPNPKYQKPFSPLVPGFHNAAYNCSAAELGKLITPSTCGVIVEPIQGEGGVNVATPEFLRALRVACDKVSAVLVYDEIQCGLGRTGQVWAHASAPQDSHPDIITTAKALGNGYPIGATIVNDSVASAVVTGDHGTTFGGNPLASRIAHNIVQRLTTAEMLVSVAAKSHILHDGLSKLQNEYPDLIGNQDSSSTQPVIRGRGLIMGLQLKSDPTPVITAARERGLLIITCGTNTIRFVPPLIITENQIRAGLSILGQALAAVRHHGDKIEGTKGQQEMAPEGR